MCIFIDNELVGDDSGWSVSTTCWSMLPRDEVTDFRSKQWNTGKAPENENNEEAKDRLLDEYVLGYSHGQLADIWARRNHAALEQAVPVNSQPSNLRDMVDLIQKGNVDKTSR